MKSSSPKPFDHFHQGHKIILTKVNKSFSPRSLLNQLHKGPHIILTKVMKSFSPKSINHFQFINWSDWVFPTNNHFTRSLDSCSELLIANTDKTDHEYEKWEKYIQCWQNIVILPHNHHPHWQKYVPSPSPSPSPPSPPSPSSQRPL